MESSINVVFEISNLKSLLENDNYKWKKFFVNFCVDTNIRSKIYVIFGSKEIINETSLINFNLIKEKLLNEIISLNSNITENDIKFGFYNNPTMFEDKQSVWFYEISDLESEDELSYKSTIFFCSDLDTIKILHYNNFFVMYLKFEDINEGKKANKALKYTNGYVDEETIDKTNYAQVSYEFLTFLESKN